MAEPARQLGGDKHDKVDAQWRLRLKLREQNSGRPPEHEETIEESTEGGPASHLRLVEGGGEDSSGRRGDLSLVESDTPADEETDSADESQPEAVDELNPADEQARNQDSQPDTAEPPSDGGPMPLGEPSKPVYDNPGHLPESKGDKKGGATDKADHKDEPKDKDAPRREDLSEKEKAAGEAPASSLYTGAGDKYGAGRALSLRGYFTRRRAIFGGGMLGTIVSLIIFLTLGSGPLQFVHVAKLMEQFHFSHQENASNDRMGRLYRYAKSGGRAGETRLGWLGSKFHANILADLEKIGLKPIYGGLDTYNGFEIDRSNPSSPYKDLSNSETVDALRQKGVNINDITFDGAKVNVTVKGYINKRASLGFLSDQIGESNIPGPIRTRVLARYGLVTWHPLKQLDIKLNQALADAFKKWQEERKIRLATGEDPSIVDPTRAQQENTDGKGNTTTTDVPEDKSTLTSDKIKSLLGDVKTSGRLKVAGGLSTVVGIVCAAKAVNDNIGTIKYYQVIAPLIRMGMDAVVVGNQIMTGQDVSSEEVSFLAKNFNTVDSSGNTVNSWVDAKSVQSELGNTGGVDIDNSSAGVRDTIAQGSPSWLSWTNNSYVGTLCSKVGSIITTGVSVIVGVFSGGTISTAGSVVAGYLAGPLVIEKLANLLSGQAVNVLATGAEWGNDINYGGRLAGNAISLAMGGVALTASEVSQLTAAENAQVQQQFDSQSIIHKIFSPTDPYSTISKLIDNSSSSLNGNINTVASVFTHFGRLFASVPKVFTPKAKAAAVIPYNYGFPEYGFSPADLNNGMVADPFDNADKAAAVLDGAGGQAYIDEALKCFGVNIVKNQDDDGVLRWDVIPGDGSKGPFSAQTNPYSDKYDSGDCAKPSGLDQNSWLRIRFFVFDTGIMEGYACFNGDDTSCANDGFSDQASSTNSPAGTGSTAGSSIDQTTLYQDSSQISCANGTRDMGIQDGYTNNQLVKIRICAVPNISSSSEESNGGFGISGGNGQLIVNSRVSGVLYQMAYTAQQAGITLTATSGFRTMSHQQCLYNHTCGSSTAAVPGYSNHQMGLAVDFNVPKCETTINGQCSDPSNPMWRWLSSNAGSFGYKSAVPDEAWHWSPTGN